jgi:hypothetical protein
MSRAGNNHKLIKIMKVQMFAVIDKAKCDTENVRGLNLAAVWFMAVQVTKLPL